MKIYHAYVYTKPIDWAEQSRKISLFYFMDIGHFKHLLKKHASRYLDQSYYKKPEYEEINVLEFRGYK